MKQNIILIGINAKYIHSNLAIHSLKAYADHHYPHRPHGCNLSLVEYTINQSVDSILADLYYKKPDVAAFSCYIWNWELVKTLLWELPKILPQITLWLGGPEVSFDAESLLKTFPQLAGVMVGEGEETFTELLHHYWEGTSSLSTICGLVYNEGYTKTRPLMDINQIPFAYDPAYTTLTTFENRILYYESQRGCPFCCAYCLSAIDKTVRLRDMKLVQSELRFFLDHAASQVKFIDRTFNCNKTHSIAIWKFIKEHDNGITNFHFEISADLLDAEQIAVMNEMRPGLIQLEIGVQSTHPDTLRAIGRHMNIERLCNNVAAIHQSHNIHLHLDLIAGLPFETYDRFAISFNEVYAMAPHQLQLGFLKVLKGSPMEQQADLYNIVFGSAPPYEVRSTQWLSYHDVLRLKKIEEMVDCYYNSGQFTHTLPVLVQLFASPFAMYEALSTFYQENGYFTNVPARAYRYQILLDFAILFAPAKQTLFAELLTFDLYVRENLKSRPLFSPENNVNREALRHFFEQEHHNPTYLTNASDYTCAQLLRMTHVECFTYPVWRTDFCETVELLESPATILFDYQNRDPLTHNARFYEICIA